MGIIKRDDIRGYHFNFWDQFNVEMVCTGCVTKEDLEGLEPDEIITERDIDRTDDKYCCDRCNREL